MWNVQKEVGHCERCGICRRKWDIVSSDMQEWVVQCKGVEYSGVRWVGYCELWNMQEGSDIARDANMQEEVGHCGRCGTCRRGWTVPEVLNMQEECDICERCEICRSRWNIVRGAEYAGASGTL